MKKLLPLAMLSMLTIPSVFAAVSIEPVKDIMQFVFEIGSFMWVVDRAAATKFAIFVVMFAVLHGVLHSGFVARTGVLNNKKVSGVISFSVAAIAVIFLPNNVAEGIGTTLSAVTAILLAGIPTGLLAWLGWSMTRGTTDPRIKHGVRLAIALAILGLIAGIAGEYGILFGIIPVTIVGGKK